MPQGWPEAPDPGQDQAHDQDGQERPAGQPGQVEPGLGQPECLDLLKLDRPDRVALADDRLALAEGHTDRDHGGRGLQPGLGGEVRAVRRVGRQDRADELGDQLPFRGLQATQDQAGDVGPGGSQVGVPQLGTFDLVEQAAGFVAHGRPAIGGERQQGGLGLVGQPRDRVLQEGLAAGIGQGRRERRVDRRQQGIELDGCRLGDRVALGRGVVVLRGDTLAGCIARLLGERIAGEGGRPGRHDVGRRHLAEADVEPGGDDVRGQDGRQGNDQQDRRDEQADEVTPGKWRRPGGSLDQHAVHVEVSPGPSGGPQPGC